jgi:hypothetical protein
MALNIKQLAALLPLCFVQEALEAYAGRMTLRVSHTERRTMVEENVTKIPRFAEAGQMSSLRHGVCESLTLNFEILGEIYRTIQMVRQSPMPEGQAEASLATTTRSTIWPFVHTPQ